MTTRVTLSSLSTKASTRTPLPPSSSSLLPFSMVKVPLALPSSVTSTVVVLSRPRSEYRVLELTFSE